MPLSNPLKQFGVHSIAFYDRSTLAILAMLRVLGEVNFNMSSENAKLQGGSQMFAWDIETTNILGEISLTGREYHPGFMEKMLGGSLTENAAEADGAVDGIENKIGTSIIDETNGLDTIELTSEQSAELKEGKYMLVATGAQVLSLYGFTNVDFMRGTDLDFENDNLLIESGIDVGSGDVNIEELGITLSAVGTPAFTTGDKAVFYIRKPNTKSYVLDFGQSGAEFAELGCYMASQKQADGAFSTLELYRVKGAGFPLNFSEKAYGEWNITMEALYDSVVNKVGRWHRTIPV